MVPSLTFLLILIIYTHYYALLYSNYSQLASLYILYLELLSSILQSKFSKKYVEPIDSWPINIHGYFKEKKKIELYHVVCKSFLWKRKARRLKTNFGPNLKIKQGLIVIYPQSIHFLRPQFSFVSYSSFLLSYYTKRYFLWVQMFKLLPLLFVLFY